MKELAVNQLDEHFIAKQQRFYILPKEVFGLGLKLRLAIKITWLHLSSRNEFIFIFLF